MNVRPVVYGAIVQLCRLNCVAHRTMQGILVAVGDRIDPTFAMQEQEDLDDAVEAVLGYAKVKYDEGGYIKPGLTTATNTGTEPEPVWIQETDDE